MIRWLWSSMMKWGWDFNRNLRRDDDEARAIPIDSRPDVCMDKALRFNLLPARGGSVLEIRTHDSKTHDWDTVTHVIPDGADVAREVGSIVAMELLKR